MPLKNKWMQPRSAKNIPASNTTAGHDSIKSSATGQPETASLLPATTNADAGVYGKFSKSATKEYGAEAVRLLGMIAGLESSPTLTDKDRTFILDMKSKAQSYGSGFVCSQGQVHWLRDVKDRLVERGEL